MLCLIGFQSGCTCFHPMGKQHKFLMTHILYDSWCCVRLLIFILSFLFGFFFLVTKIRPELTSDANPPLFAEEDWPWANIVPIFLYFIWDATTAWLDNWCLSAHPGSEPANPGLPKWSTRT